MGILVLGFGGEGVLGVVSCRQSWELCQVIIGTVFAILQQPYHYMDFTELCQVIWGLG